jgi:hypothetical protein
LKQFAMSLLSTLRFAFKSTFMGTRSSLNFTSQVSGIRKKEFRVHHTQFPLGVPFGPGFRLRNTLASSLSCRVMKSSLQGACRYQMHMVGHEAVCPNLHVKLPAPFSHQINIDAVVLMTKKGRQSAIAALYDVMRHSRSHHSCYLPHRRILENKTRSSTIKYGVPRTPQNSQRPFCLVILSAITLRTADRIFLWKKLLQPPRQPKPMILSRFSQCPTTRLLERTGSNFLAANARE